MWLLEHAATEFGTDRLLIGGSSAGAHLAALTLLRIRDRLGADAIDRFLGANLVFGAYDLGMTATQRTADDALVIPLAMLEACFAHFLPGLDREARRDPSYSPLYADLQDLVPALFTVGTSTVATTPHSSGPLGMAGNTTDAGVPRVGARFQRSPPRWTAAGTMQAWLRKQVARTGSNPSSSI
jgi:acetyl esterase/lipase